LQFVIINGYIKYGLYSPLLTIIEERKEYILTNLGKASSIKANKLTTQYEQERINVQRSQITNSQFIKKS
jgi:F0F1-type ATP synthase membrane subunit b/b'